ILGIALLLERAADATEAGDLTPVGIEMPRHQRQRGEREKLDVSLRLEGEREIPDQNEQNRNAGPPPTHGEAGQDQGDGVEEELATEEVEVGRIDPLGLLEEERLPEERHEVKKKAVPVCVENHAADREQESEAVIA